MFVFNTQNQQEGGEEVNVEDVEENPDLESLRKVLGRKAKTRIANNLAREWDHDRIIQHELKRLHVQAHCANNVADTLQRAGVTAATVSYTHLTLPTILLV